MRITKNERSQPCAVCGRRLLMGEEFTRFSPGHGHEYYPVCKLCTPRALDAGWIREGSPTTPTVEAAAPRRRGGLLGSLLGTARQPLEESVASDPLLDRLSDDELSVVEAADLFNASAFRRTIAGVYRALGPPRASILPIPGTAVEMVITIAWDLSWYQYRVSLEAANPVRLVERGQDPSELGDEYTESNASVEPDGKLIPAVAVLPDDMPIEALPVNLADDQPSAGDAADPDDLDPYDSEE